MSSLPASPGVPDSPRATDQGPLAGGPSRALITRNTMLVDGLARRYLRISPAGRSACRAAVLVLHGSGQSVSGFRRYSGGTFDALTARGAVVAYLEGYRHGWNDARVISGSASRRHDIDDVAFAAAVIEDLVANAQVDSARVFVAGFSAGGYLAIRLIHEIPELISGVGLLSATQAHMGNFRVKQDREVPMAVTLFHGTRDYFVPYLGERPRQRLVSPRGGMLSAPATARYFARRNGILVPPLDHIVSPGLTETVYEEHSKPVVRLLTVHGAGHTIPGASGWPIAGTSTRTIVAAQTFADDWKLAAS